MADQTYRESFEPRQEPTGIGAEEGGRVAGETREWSRERGMELLKEQKGKAADIINDLANALHSSARQLEEQEHPASAHYLHRAAGTLESFSGNIRHREIDEITYRVKDFARRQPIVVLAGTMVVGFYLARLLKSGSERSEESTPLSTPGTEQGGLTGDVPLH